MRIDRKLFVLGTRGVPAQHGGFETFAEKLALYLVGKGWEVVVYCQENGSGAQYETEWKGVKRIHIPVEGDGAASTVFFDWKTVSDALNRQGLFLTLGYNTAIFNFLQRLKGQTNIINMDGIEWRRDKWGMLAKTWFWLNERAGCWFGTHLVADHPEIKTHLATRVSASKITMIPYGADSVSDADSSVLDEFSIEKNNYSIIIARPEPENSILEMVSAFSSKPRGHKLVVLGSYDQKGNEYHRKVISAASDEVIFVGAIYEVEVVKALRFYARFYLHGHRVGGTNPSLVEAMGAGSAVIAHDNRFNRWVAGPGAHYFSDVRSCAQLFDELLEAYKEISIMKEASLSRFCEKFTWEQILGDYEALLERYLPKSDL